MTPVVAPPHCGPYVAAMTAGILTRLLAAFALLLMPLGMAAAGPAMAHAPVATASASHCDEAPDEQEAPPARSIDCAMACSALAPAPFAPIEADPPAGLRRSAEMPRQIGGLHPEAAIPPPRSS
jgi:hypothetical protein